ncbi:MAG: sigma-70 family RNA polymerase sigma factor [Beijerinckiaceae bacterium]|nr:sigma-70 family RNA polymerase sigma factor [Beijerinckiaceae bacterium]
MLQGQSTIGTRNLVCPVDAVGTMGLYRGMGSGRDKPSFDDFFRREFERTVRTAYLVLHDQEAAEDVAQDAFGQLYASWGRVSLYDVPQAWVRRVAIRMAVRAARRDARRRALSRSDDLRPMVPGREAGLDLEAALRSLPAQQRAAVALHYYADLPIDEASAAMGCSASTVRTHLARARARLAELLTEEVVDDHAE